MKLKTFHGCKVLIGSFIINILFAGTARLSSIFFVESITRYNTDRKAASFPYVLCYLVRNFGGPLVGYLEQIFGMQTVITGGCWLGTIAVGACFFAEDILTITILWGGIFGMSYGLASLLLAPLLNEVFQENKSKANGCVYAGSCIGAVLLPPIMEVCVERYGVSGAFLILSAIISNCIPFAFLLKKPNKTTKIAVLQNYHVQDRHPESDIDNLTTPLNKLTAEGSTCSKNLTLNAHNYDKTHLCVPKLPSSKGNGSHVDVSQTTKSQSCPEVSICKKSEHSLDSSEIPRNLSKLSFVMISNPSCEYEKCKVSNGGDQASMERQGKKNLFTLQNFKIFVDPTYINFLIMHAIHAFLMTTIWTIVLDFARDRGVHKNTEIYIVICLPVSDFIGRFGSGFLIDRKFCADRIMQSACFLSLSLSMILFVYANDYILLMVGEALVSIFLGMTSILQISLVHEFMVGDHRTMAMTCRHLLYGPLSLATSPMIGYFRGYLGSYNNVFYILSGMSLIPAIGSFCLPYLASRRNLQ